MKPTQIVQTIFEQIKSRVRKDFCSNYLNDDEPEGIFNGFCVITYNVENRKGVYEIIPDNFAYFPILKSANTASHTFSTVIIEDKKILNRAVVIYDAQTKRIIDRENGLYCSFEWVLTIEGIRMNSFKADTINIDKLYEITKSKIVPEKTVDNIYPASQAWSTQK